MFPTPDPSASLTTWQVYVSQRDDAMWVAVSTLSGVAIVALMLLLFLIAAGVIIVGYRRR